MPPESPKEVSPAVSVFSTLFPLLEEDYTSISPITIPVPEYRPEDEFIFKKFVTSPFDKYQKADHRPRSMWQQQLPLEDESPKPHIAAKIARLGALFHEAEQAIKQRRWHEVEAPYRAALRELLEEVDTGDGSGRVPLYLLIPKGEKSPDGRRLLYEAIFGVAAYNSDPDDVKDNLDLLNGVGEGVRNKIGQITDDVIDAKVKLLRAYTIMFHTSAWDVQKFRRYLDVQEDVHEVVESFHDDPKLHFPAQALLIELLARRMERAHHRGNQRARRQLSKSVLKELKRFTERYSEGSSDQKEVIPLIEAHVAILLARVGMWNPALKKAREITENEAYRGTPAVDQLLSEPIFKRFVEDGKILTAREMKKRGWSLKQLFAEAQATVANARFESFGQGLWYWAGGAVFGIAIDMLQNGFPPSDAVWPLLGVFAASILGKLRKGSKNQETREAGLVGQYDRTAWESFKDVGNLILHGGVSAVLAWPLCYWAAYIPLDFVNEVVGSSVRGAEFWARLITGELFSSQPAVTSSLYESLVLPKGFWHYLHDWVVTLDGVNDPLEFLHRLTISPFAPLANAPGVENGVVLQYVWNSLYHWLVNIGSTNLAEFTQGMLPQHLAWLVNAQGLEIAASAAELTQTLVIEPLAWLANAPVKDVAAAAIQFWNTGFWDDCWQRFRDYVVAPYSWSAVAFSAIYMFSSFLSPNEKRDDFLKNVAPFFMLGAIMFGMEAGMKISGQLDHAKHVTITTLAVIESLFMLAMNGLIARRGKPKGVSEADLRSLEADGSKKKQKRPDLTPLVFAAMTVGISSAMGGQIGKGEHLDDYTLIAVRGMIIGMWLFPLTLIFSGLLKRTIALGTGLKEGWQDAAGSHAAWRALRAFGAGASKFWTPYVFQRAARPVTFDVPAATARTFVEWHSVGGFALWAFINTIWTSSGANMWRGEWSSTVWGREAFMRMLRERNRHEIRDHLEKASQRLPITEIFGPHTLMDKLYLLFPFQRIWRSFPGPHIPETHYFSSLSQLIEGGFDQPIKQEDVQNLPEGIEAQVDDAEMISDDRGDVKKVRRQFTKEDVQILLEEIDDMVEDAKRIKDAQGDVEAQARRHKLLDTARRLALTFWVHRNDREYGEMIRDFFKWHQSIFQMTGINPDKVPVVEGDTRRLRQKSYRKILKDEEPFLLFKENDKEYGKGKKPSQMGELFVRKPEISKGSGSSPSEGAAVSSQTDFERDSGTAPPSAALVGIGDPSPEGGTPIPAASGILAPPPSDAAAKPGYWADVGTYDYSGKSLCTGQEPALGNAHLIQGMQVHLIGQGYSIAVPGAWITTPPLGALHMILGVQAAFRAVP